MRMRKRIVAFALAVIVGLAVFTLPLIAYASDTARMDVSLTLTEDDVTPPYTPSPGNNDPEPCNPSFFINIPASISLNNETDFIFTWVNNNVGYNQWVTVSIDGAQTFTDDRFYLVQGDGSTDSQRVVCAIDRGVYGSPFLQRINGPGDVLVAQFHGDRDSDYASTFGRLVFTPSYSFDNVAGTYTGTIHFKITFNCLRECCRD